MLHHVTHMCHYVSLRVKVRKYFYLTIVCSEYVALTRDERETLERASERRASLLTLPATRARAPTSLPTLASQLSPTIVLQKDQAGRQTGEAFATY